MENPCDDCGGARAAVRTRFDIPLPAGRFIAEGVPAMRCEACGRTDAAAHVRPQLNAVMELAQDAEGATVRKDFGALPLHPQ